MQDPKNTLTYPPAHISNTINEQYDRTQALDRLSTQKYRADVISGNLEDYIVQRTLSIITSTHSVVMMKDLLSLQNIRRRQTFSEEFRTNGLSLSTANDPPLHGVYLVVSWVICLWWVTQSLSLILFSELFEPDQMYCALVAILYPSTFSVSSIAILQQSSATLRYSLTNVLQNADSFRRQLNDIRNLYNATNASSGLANGQKPYPDPSSESKGMSFDLRYVDGMTVLIARY